MGPTTNPPVAPGIIKLYIAWNYPPGLNWNPYKPSNLHLWLLLGGGVDRIYTHFGGDQTIQMYVCLKDFPPKELALFRLVSYNDPLEAGGDFFFTSRPYWFRRLRCGRFSKGKTDEPESPWVWLTFATVSGHLTYSKHSKCQCSWRNFVIPKKTCWKKRFIPKEKDVFSRQYFFSQGLLQLVFCVGDLSLLFPNQAGSWKKNNDYFIGSRYHIWD